MQGGCRRGGGRKEEEERGQWPGKARLGGKGEPFANRTFTYWVFALVFILCLSSCPFSCCAAASL